MKFRNCLPAEASAQTGKLKIEKYHQAVYFLESLINLPIRNYELKQNDRSFFIDRLRFLLKLLNDPQRGFKYIHVAGTAGKGTTVNMIHEMLNFSGHKVGSYFSPHATTSIERIKANDLYIIPSDFAELIDELKPALIECALKSPFGHPSYFETFLALAFLHFKRQKCEYVVLEAGLGGTHDATNIIEKPKITVITNINYDHTEILGKTLSAIARDKAGIIKKGAIFLTTETRPHLIKIFQEKCRSVDAKFYSFPIFQTDKNAALAQEVGKILNLNPIKINWGIKQAKLPCRFEIIKRKPLIILDGSHNPAKMTKVAENLKKITYHKLILIAGMAEDKDQQKTLKQILPLAEKIILTRFLNPFRKTANLKDLFNICKITKRANQKVCQFIDPFQALDYGLKIQKPADCLLITGSFFLTGELRTKWISEEYILHHRKSF